MSIEPEPITPSPEQLLEPQATRLAMWLLWRDRGVLLLLFPILVMVPLLRHNFAQTDLALLLLVVVDRLAELTFLFFVTRRALVAFKIGSTHFGPKQLIRYAVFGFGLWALFQAGLLFQLAADSPRSILVSGACTALGTIFGLRYFYYFLPALAGDFSLRQIAAIARCFVRTRPLLGLRSLLPAIAWPVFLSGVVTVFSPDGRLLEVTIAVDLISGLFFIISTYLSLAIAQTFCDEGCWTMLGAKSPFVLSQSERRKRGNERLLTRRTSLQLIAAACLVWIGNAVLNLTTPPAAKIEVLELIAKDRGAALKLRISDPKYALRGLELQAFSLAGETRVPVSIRLISARLASGVEIDTPLESREEQIVVLEFETDRRSEDLAALKDLYLWYKLQKITHVEALLSGRI